MVCGLAADDVYGLLTDIDRLAEWNDASREGDHRYWRSPTGHVGHLERVVPVQMPRLEHAMQIRDAYGFVEFTAVADEL
jgi:hypothetical protein